MQRIVVGVDGSEGSAKALAWAIAEAKLRDARVEAVAAWEPPYLEGYPYIASRVDPSELEVGAKAVVEEAVAAVDAAGVRVDCVTRCGAAASVLVEAARDASLVVVGSRGRGGFAGLLLGSVSQQVANHAPCPVVIVR